MEYKVYILNHCADFSCLQLEKALAQQNCTLGQLSFYCDGVQNFDDILSSDGSKLLFLASQDVDDAIKQSINLLSNDKQVVDEMAVVFNKDDDKVVFIPYDCDWQSLLAKINLNEKRANKQMVFKLFGIGKPKIEEALHNLSSQIPDFMYTVVEDEKLKCNVYISYSGSENLIDNSQVLVASALKDYIYSENSLDLAQTLAQMLKLKELKLAMVEGITAGSLVAKICQSFDKPQQILSSARVEYLPGEIDADSVYNQALGLIEKGGDDLFAVAVQGEYKDNCLTLMYSIGNKKSIDVYKNVLRSSKSQAIEFALDVIMFNIIKKLRQNNLVF